MLNHHIAQRRSDGEVALATPSTYGSRHLELIFTPENLRKGIEGGTDSSCDNYIGVSDTQFEAEWQLLEHLPTKEKQARVQRCLDGVLPIAKELEAKSKEERPHHCNHLTGLLLSQLIKCQLVEGEITISNWNGFFQDGTSAYALEDLATALRCELGFCKNYEKSFAWALNPTAETWATNWTNLRIPLNELTIRGRNPDAYSAITPEFIVDPKDGKTIKFVTPTIPWKQWGPELVTEYTLEVPSGTLLVSNDLRGFFPDENDYDLPKHPELLPEDYVKHPAIQEHGSIPFITLNHPIGLRAAALRAAKQGRGEIYIGSCSAYWVQHKPTGTILPLRHWPEEDLPKEYNVFETINSDLWWAHFTDLKKVQAQQVYALWPKKEQRDCHVTPESFTVWKKKYSSFTVKLGKAKALRVHTNGKHKVDWTDPQTGKVMKAYAIITPAPATPSKTQLAGQAGLPWPNGR